MKKLIRPKPIWLGLALVLIAGAVYYKVSAASPKETLAVTTAEATAEKGDLVISLESDGTATIPYTNIDFQISGQLTKVYVKTGDQIVKGQKLAEIDPAEYEKAYQSAKLSYEKALLNYQSKAETQKLDNQSGSQQVADYKLKYEQLQKEYQVMLQIKDSYSQAELDAKKIEMDSAKRSYDSEAARYKVTSSSDYALAIEKTNVEAAKLQLETAKQNLDQTTLVSEIDGVVLMASYSEGDLVSPQSDSGSLTASSNHFIVATSSSNFDVLTSVSEQDLSMVSLGQSAEVTFDALDGEKYTGKVTAVEQLPNTDSSGVVSYNATVSLDSGFEDIKIGMTAQLQLILKKAEDVIIIPNKAVSFDSGQQTVKVKLQDGSTEVRKITAGLTDGRNVAVTEGLSAGEVVVYETTSK